MVNKLRFLKSLTFPNASFNDPIFSVLPPTLEELVITSYPLPYVYDMAGYNIPVRVMPYADLSKILRNGSFRFLQRLDVAYDAEPRAADAALFGALPDICPDLIYLEINRYTCPYDEDLYGITVSILRRTTQSLVTLCSHYWKQAFHRCRACPH